MSTVLHVTSTQGVYVHGDVTLTTTPQAVDGQLVADLVAAAVTENVGLMVDGFVYYGVINIPANTADGAIAFHTVPGPPLTGTWTAGTSVVDIRGDTWQSTVAGTPGTWALSDTDKYVSLNGGSTILVPTNGTDGLFIQFQAGSTGHAIQVKDHFGAPIAAIGPAGGMSVFGDNNRIFAGGDVFNPVVKMFGSSASPGTVQLAKGDIAGGVGVLAMGDVTTAPSSTQPDGSHVTEGSTSSPGVIYWSRKGRPVVMDGSGTVSELVAHTKRRHASVVADLNATTVSSFGIPAPTVTSPAAAAAMFNAVTGMCGVNMFTGATSGNVAKLAPASFVQTAGGFSPMVFFRLRTDASSVANSRIWAGLFSATPETITSPTGITCAGFRYDTSAGDTTWKCITSAASASPTVVDSGVTVTAAAITEFRIEVNYNNTSYRFFINDNVVATITTTLPANATNVAPMCSLTTLTTASVGLGFGRMVLTALG